MKKQMKNVASLVYYVSVDVVDMPGIEEDFQALCR